MVTLGTATNRKTGHQEELSLSSQERAQSTYVIGTTGTGKTTLLKNMAVEDMWHNPTEGFCVLDPHGDLVDELLLWVPEARKKDVVYFNPHDINRPFGLNLLACDRENEHEVRWVVSTIKETLYRLFLYSWGPRLEHVLINTLYTVLKRPDSTLIDVLLILSSREFRESHYLGKDINDQESRLSPKSDFLLTSFWYDWFFKLSGREQTEVVSSTLNKLTPFLLDSMMRNIIGQTENSFNLTELMDEGKILLVNLSKGDLGEHNSALLGSVLINLILMAALRRRGPKYRDGRRPFHVIVDEYQNFANPSFAILQSEARKFGVDLIVAHQYRDQLDDLSLGASLNVGNFIVFRTSGQDSHLLASQFDNTPPEPEMEWERVRTPSEQWPGIHFPGVGEVPVPGPRRLYTDVQAETANNLSILPNYQAYSRLIRRPENQLPHLGEYHLKVHAQPDVPLDLSDPEQRARAEQIREEIIDYNHHHYGKDRAGVERSVYERTGLYGHSIITHESPPASGMV